MEVVIIFVVAWIVRAAWDAKVSEFRASQKQTRKQVNLRHPHASKDRREQMVRNAARRNAAGYGAYQLRHGWPALWTALRDGWDDAKKGHQEWLADHPKKPGGGWSARWARCRSAWTSAWAAAKRKFIDTAEKIGPADNTPSAAPKAPKGPLPRREPLRVIPPYDPSGSASTTHGGTMDTHAGEAGGYAAAQQVTDGYNSSLGNAQEQLEQYEADLIAGGLDADPNAMATLTQAREGLQQAQAAFSGHKGALTDHEQGHEYATSKGEAAAKTEWLAGGA